MKLYTKRGDAGQTDLFGGQRVEKDDRRIHACGDVDELNSFVGLAGVVCADEQLKAILNDIQNRLFELGADLATPRDANQPAGPSPSAIPRITSDHVHNIEKTIDEVCEPLDPMTHFILPGGSELAAHLHIARTVCRRAERACITLKKRDSISDDAVIYLNRLSDLLFAMARRANQLAGIPDVPWLGPRGA